MGNVHSGISIRLLASVSDGYTHCFICGPKTSDTTHRPTTPFRLWLSCKASTRPHSPIVVPPSLTVVVSRNFEI